MTSKSKISGSAAGGADVVWSGHSESMCMASDSTEELSTTVNMVLLPAVGYLTGKTGYWQEEETNLLTKHLENH